MYKWMYDRMKDEYEKKSKEELMQEIMSLEEIECSDRAFANHCEASLTIYNINELFKKLTLILEKRNITDNDLVELSEVTDSAKSSWNFIKREISEINDNGRYYSNLDSFKNKVSKAINPYDSI